MLDHSMRSIATKHEHRLLGFMLITLHLALWWDITSLLAQVLLFVHLGLFIVWQPVWSKYELPNMKSVVAVIITIIAFILFLNHWIVTLWQIVLLGLLGGRDLVKPRDRFVNIAAIIFLIIDLLIINVHQLFIVNELTTLTNAVVGIDWLLVYGLLCLPLVFLFIPVDDTAAHRSHIDFFHGLSLALFVVIIALGSLIIMYYGHTSYPLAVFQMSLGMALFILTVSWVWVMFSSGEDNVDQLWTRHLLNIGSSFDQWLSNLAEPSNYKTLTPKQFLEAGLQQLTKLPWVTGIVWQSSYGDGLLGKQDKHQVNVAIQSLDVTVYSHHRISGSHYFHVKLLIQLLEHFHQAKRREEAFARQAHLQAIYETGAKLTHDIKNLLQSLHAITTAIETCHPAQFGDTQRLLQGQMPHLTQRLKRTLDKLQKPTEFAYSNVPVRFWWDNLQARYAKQRINFQLKSDADNVLIPEDLFDNVVENLLQNTLSKRKREPELQIEVTLHINKRTLKITVCDDGSAIPTDIAANLLTQPVPSRDGFGIGLYQAAKQIANTGYCLNIRKNVDGQVCFELASME